MNNFSQIIVEARKNYDSESLLSSEVTNYINKVNKVIPEQVKRVIYLTQKYNLMDRESIDEILKSNKGSLKGLSNKYNISLDELIDFWEMLKGLKTKIKLLPQYQSTQERQAIELGKLSMDDLTIDLESEAGRKAATHMYMPMIYKIVGQYVGKSKLSKQELISAALLGFTNAMRDWKRDEEGKNVTFKTYAGYRAKQQILNDIDEFGHTLSGTNWYASKVYGAGLLDAVSIDGLPKDADGDFAQDHLSFMGDEPDYNLSRDEKKQWSSLYDLIEKHFKQRDIDIFYRYFGLKGYKREKSKDIAKQYGMSEGNIRNTVINKMLNFLKNDKKAADILQDIQDIYAESLMIEMVGYSKEEIMEALVNDDMFILLEELTKWNNKTVFSYSIIEALKGFNESDIKIIKKIIESDFEYLDDNLKKYKKIIILFLSNLHPTENMNRKTDVDLLEYMIEVQNYYKKYGEIL